MIAKSPIGKCTAHIEAAGEEKDNQDKDNY